MLARLTERNPVGAVARGRLWAPETWKRKSPGAASCPRALRFTGPAGQRALPARKRWMRAYFFFAFFFDFLKPTLPALGS